MSHFLIRPGAAFAVCAVLALGLIAGACGDDDDDDGGNNNDAVVEAMIAEGAPEEDARCLVDELGDDAERLFTAADEDLSDDDQEKLLDALEECNIS